MEGRYQSAEVMGIHLCGYEETAFGMACSDTDKVANI
jgi:hypothetical protein